MSDIDYKIEKYTFKLKHTPNTQNAKIYREKIKHYKNEKKQYGGNDEVDQIIKASQTILNEKMSDTDKSPVYAQSAVNSFINELSKKIDITVDKYNKIANEKTQLCNNTIDLTNQMKNIKSGCTEEQFNLKTEELLNDKKFIESICDKKSSDLQQVPISISTSPSLPPKMTTSPKISPLSVSTNLINKKLDEIDKEIKVLITRIIDNLNQNKNYQLSDQDKRDFISLIQTLRVFIADSKNNLDKANEKSKIVSDDLKSLFNIHIVKQFFLSTGFKFGLIGQPEKYECLTNCVIKIPTLFLPSGADIQNKIADSFETNMTNVLIK